MQYIMLCCKRHTAENTAHYFDEVTSAINISDKVTTVVTDNAYNVVNPLIQSPLKNGDLNCLLFILKSIAVIFFKHVQN